MISLDISQLFRLLSSNFNFFKDFFFQNTSATAVNTETALIISLICSVSTDSKSSDDISLTTSDRISGFYRGLKAILDNFFFHLLVMIKCDSDTN